MKRYTWLSHHANVEWACYSEKRDNATAQKGSFEVDGAVIIIQSLPFFFIFMERFLHILKIHVELISVVDFIF